MPENALGGVVVDVAMARDSDLYPATAPDFVLAALPDQTAILALSRRRLSDLSYEVAVLHVLKSTPLDGFSLAGYRLSVWMQCRQRSGFDYE